jgi:hypothetical protein
MQITPSPARLALAAVLTAAGCGGELFEANRFIDEAVDLEGASAIVLDVPVPVRVTGAAGRTQLTFTGTITVSTSSAARSRALADALEVRVERDGGALTAGLQVPGRGGGTPFPEATLRGILDVGVPAGLPLQVLQRGGSVELSGVAADVDIRSVGPVQVRDAPASTSVRCDNGPVEIQTRAAPGSRTFLGMVAGSEARVILPAALNARVRAETGDGRIFLSHPRLPPGPADPYDVVAGTALAEVEVSVGRGNIVFLAR